ncbi:hypothetical protein ABZ372_54075 [Streptomyces sp. NPDC005921]|uniref:hypothetical protein n=1 Tax=Streptomyces sp. NPDC005827 TaxID=3157070 RepID=UPI0033E9764F
MSPRSRLLATVATGLTAVLLAGCDGGGSTADDKAVTRTSVSPSASPAVAPGRPTIVLPSDLSYTFDRPSSGGTTEDAILADSEQNIKAVDLAIANQDPSDSAYRFYFEGEAAAQIQRYVQAYVTAGARTARTRARPTTST